MASQEPTNSKLRATVSEDVDDLDDLLDEFDAAPAQKQTTSTASSSTTTATTTSTATSTKTAAAAASNEIDANEEELLKEFEKGMEALLGGLPAGKAAAATADGAAADDDAEDAELPAELKSAMEDFIKAMNSAAAAGNDSDTAAASTTTSTATAKSNKSAGTARGTNKGKSFMDRIDATRSKLDESAAKADEALGGNGSKGASKAEGGDTDGMMEQMMAEMEKLIDSDGMEGIVEEMMKNIVSKDILYDSIKELDNKYPEWLQRNNDSLSKSGDLEKYTKQASVVRQICSIFEDANYNDSMNPKVMDLLQQMQDLGNPPEALIKELAPDAELGADGMPKLPENFTKSMPPGLDADACKQM